MAPSTLRFSVGSLLGHALLSTLFCTAIAAIALDVNAGGSIRGLGLVEFLGRDSARAYLAAGTLLTGLGALNAWRRLFGNRIAAAIHHDGIELRGLLLSRRIPWRALDRLGLRSFTYKGTTAHFIAAKSRRPRGASFIHHRLAGLSCGVPVSLLEGSLTDAAHWVERAHMARHVALGESASWRFDEGLAPTRPRPGIRGRLGRRNG